MRTRATPTRTNVCGISPAALLGADTAAQWRNDMRESQFTVKSPEGQSHKVQGDPSILTLRDVIGEVGKTGGQRLPPGGVRFRVAGKEYREQDFDRTLTELGIQPGTPIEIVAN